MMFSLNFAFVLLFTLAVRGQNNDINTFRTQNSDRSFSFNKLRQHNQEGRQEEPSQGSESERFGLKQEQSAGVQPLNSPCIGARPLSTIAYPNEKTKYFQCRDEFHYEVFTCPQGGEYNDETKSCDEVVPSLNRCEQEKPCLNDGQCSIASNATFKCTCRQDWTGDRCETPINSCVTKPCGADGECRPLTTTDYKQDYVCICDRRASYGLNCRETVPNPCMVNSDQFFPFAFSPRAYIQCDGEMLFFQPCGSHLYWNQEDKICDRKRPANYETTKLVAKPNKQSSNDDEENYDDDEEEEKEMNIVTTTVKIEQAKPVPTRNRFENERSFGFVPSKFANRVQVTQEPSMRTNNNQQVQNVEFQNQGPSSVGSAQLRAQQWPRQQTRPEEQQTDSNMRQTLPIQSGRNQPWSQNTQTQRIVSEPSSIDQSAREAQLPMRSDNQQKQAFTSQLRLNQMQETNVPSSQRFVPQKQQESFLETTTLGQNLVRPQVISNSNSRDQASSRPVNTNQVPQTVGFKVQSNVAQPQSWQSSQQVQNQQPFFSNLPETTTQDNRNRLNLVDSSSQQQWQSKGNNQMRVDNSQPTFKPQETAPIHPESLIDMNNNPPQRMMQSSVRSESQQNFPQQKQAFGGQWQDSDAMKTQRFVPQQQSTQGSQASALPTRQQNEAQQWTPTWISESPLETSPSQKGSPSTIRLDNQQRNQMQDMSVSNNQRFVPQQQQQQQQQNFLETTTMGQNVVRLQGFANSNIREQELPRTTMPTIQQKQSQRMSSQSNPIFAFQPRQWPDNSNKQNQASLNNDASSSQIQTNQMDMNRQPSSNGQFMSNNFETTTLTNNRGSVMQDSSAWQSNRNQASPMSGSWMSRS